VVAAALRLSAPLAKFPRVLFAISVIAKVPLGSPPYQRDTQKFLWVLFPISGIAKSSSGFSSSISVIPDELLRVLTCYAADSSLGRSPNSSAISGIAREYS
jgi:hypothetical protein